MTLAPSQLAVVARTDSYKRLLDVVTATHQSVGVETTIVALCQPAIILDFRNSGKVWPNVHLVNETSSIDDIMPLIQATYVLCFPPSSPIFLTGVSGAVGLLESSQEIDEVGGLIIGSRGAVVSGAFLSIHQTSSDSIALASIEETHPSWTRYGSFAHTQADYLGGLSVVRRASLSEGHIHHGSLVGRALSSPRSGNTTTKILFSGLIALTRLGVDTPYNESGEIELLSGSSHAAWSAAGLREVFVFQRGPVLRNDKLGEVVHLADNRIAAVDGGGRRPALDPARYYTSVSSRVQLGHGFWAMTDWLVRVNQSVDHSYINGLTELERLFLNRARRFAALLPRPLLNLLKLLIKRSSSM